MPDILFRLDGKGQPLFKDFADAIVPTRTPSATQVRYEEVSGLSRDFRGHSISDFFDSIDPLRT